MAELVDLSKRDFPATIYKIPLGDRWNSNDYHFAQCELNEVEGPSERQWELSESHVQDLMQSIKSDKMICPIGVQFLKTRNGSHRFRLIYGLHRFEATKRLRAEYLAQNPDVDPNRDSTYFTANAAVFSCDLTEEQMHRIEAIENLKRRVLTDEEKTRVATVLSSKNLAKVTKAKAIIERAAKQVANVPKAEEKDFIEKSIISPKSKTNPGKPVTQMTIAEAEGVSQPTVLEAFKTVESLTGVKIDLNKPETIEAANARMATVMVMAAEDDVVAEDVRTKLDKSKKSSKASEANPERVKSTAELAVKMGRPDLAQKIESADDKRLAAVDVADELGIGIRRQYRFESHHDASMILSKLQSNLDPAVFSELAYDALLASNPDPEFHAASMLKRFGRKRCSIYATAEYKLLKDTPIE